MIQPNRVCSPAARAAFVVLVVSVLAGCAALGPGPDPEEEVMAPDGIVYRESVPSKSRRVFSKSYEIGQRYTVSAGEPLVSIKNYTVQERVARAIVLEDFEQQCGAALGGAPGACDDGLLGKARGSLGDVFDVVGAVTVGGFLYYMIDLDADGGDGYLLADPEGYLRPVEYIAWRAESDRAMHRRGLPHETIAPAFAVETSGPLFQYETEDTFLRAGSGYLNYDLIFRGTEYGHHGTMIHLVYREYRRDATQTPAYQTVLTYPASRRYSR